MLGIPVLGGYFIAGALALGAGSGFYLGWHEKSLRADAAQLKVERNDNAAVQQEEIKFILISTNVEAKLETINVNYAATTHLVDRIVTRDIYRAECIDDDGLLAINSALTGQAPTASGPRPALSVTIPAGEQGRGGANP